MVKQVSVSIYSSRCLCHHDFIKVLLSSTDTFLRSIVAGHAHVLGTQYVVGLFDQSPGHHM